VPPMCKKIRIEKDDEAALTFLTVSAFEMVCQGSGCCCCSSPATTPALHRQLRKGIRSCLKRCHFVVVLLHAIISRDEC
jgi:hypothetical protein